MVKEEEKGEFGRGTEIHHGLEQRGPEVHNVR